MWAPLFVELRNVIDWLSTDTSFTLMEWFKLEDCYHSVYDLKCKRAFERACGRARGRGRGKACGPLAAGVAILLLLILLLWFPLVLFRLRQQLGQPARPRAVALRLAVGLFPPLYEGRSYSARQFTDAEWKTLNSLYSLNRRALESLQYFHAADLVVARLPLGSKMWDITEETRRETVTLRMVWEVEYDLLQTIRGYTTRSFARGDAVRRGLAAAVNASPASPAPPVGVDDILPKFLDSARLLRSEGDFGDVAATDAFLTERGRRANGHAPSGRENG
ncbi:Piezo-type mechanosensitive ion channel component [Gryllus bimaculatus]|nr:Piezo-type mechanosensitive ion channel component [Gryllus bimaculatus]